MRNDYRTKDEAEGAILMDEVAHEIKYWIGQRVTFEQWVALDDAFDEVFDRILGPDADVSGVAGPIPFDNPE